MFKKLLVANRGEIACRVMRSARALGYRTVAVYSDADADAPHVAQADEAVRLGPAPAAQSYLDIDALLAAARATGADAVHPGYGFLSERADFAQACADAGLVFIGPPAAAITAMGDKARAKRRMIEAGVPCVPGYLGDDQADARLTAEARALGYPLLVKAVAGGGGRGMRLVRAEGELASALAGARREAANAFGDGTLMLERLIERGRHIEIQVFADRHGHTIHLGERDCTAQRRRQKVIEEAPSPVVSAALREAMGRDAVAAARAVGYVGAGTVEFIVDEAMQHHFLEMNTRLQVEHPVTECITGLDLVAWQLRVAAGEPLPLAQDEVAFKGHAIEVRLYAEDPYDGFKPQTGRILHWQPEAALHDGVRIDHGMAAGQQVTPHYDAMVAKLIAHGRDRADAVRRLVAALDDAPLVGPAHNARYLRDLLQHPDFTAARMHTALLDDWAAQAAPIHQPPRPGDALWLAAAALRMQGQNGARRQAAAWRPAGLAESGLTLRCGGAQRALRVATLRDGSLRVILDGQPHDVRVVTQAAHQARLLIDGIQCSLRLLRDGDHLHLVDQAAVFCFDEPSPAPAASDAIDPHRAHAPVAGTVAQVLVGPGDQVAAGQPLVSVEAMKMEMWVHAGAAGTVAHVAARAGISVKAGALLVQLQPAVAQDT
jgi:geranyl-CoA carboxylase alpha subunit